MKAALTRILLVYVSFVVVFAVAKGLFMLYNAAAYSGVSAFEVAQVMANGLPMDLATAGYFTVVPLLLMIAGIWTAQAQKLLNALWGIYRWFSAGVIAVGVVADAVLYPFWGFKLDVTPLFYFLTSPSAAAASVSMWQVGVGIIVLLLLAWAIGWFLGKCWRLGTQQPIKNLSARWASTGLMVLVGGFLFLAIRGGVSEATMNLSSAYFSTDTRLNHAAVNPLFSFLYSAAHQDNFAEQFRYFPEDEARRIYSEAVEGDAPTSEVSKEYPTVEGRPDIYLVIMESFNSHLFPTLGGEPVAERLDSVARTGVLFTRCLASGNRTDRALPAILAGYPAQPNTSLMKYSGKTDRLPSLPRALASAGYHLTYYYGGDAKFTNMGSFLRSAGFDRVVSDKDFPVKDRLSKWGVPDHLLFSRVMSDLDTLNPAASPTLTVVQTSSSHEPFEVPFTSRWANPRANAFAYADSCIAGFVDALAASPRWENALVVLVPDHYGGYPERLKNPVARHQIPLIFTGGALRGVPARIDDVCSQTDLAATLLGMLGMENPGMTFSHDLFNPADGSRHAFFCEPDFAGFMDAEGNVGVVSTATGETIYGDPLISPSAKAYLQTLYTDLSQR